MNLPHIPEVVQWLGIIGGFSYTTREVGQVLGKLWDRFLARPRFNKATLRAYNMATREADRHRLAFSYWMSAGKWPDGYVPPAEFTPLSNSRTPQ
jgi:hypothetical protein